MELKTAKHAIWMPSYLKPKLISILCLMLMLGIAYSSSFTVYFPDGVPTKIETSTQMVSINISSQTVNVQDTNTKYAYALINATNYGLGSHNLNSFLTGFTPAQGGGQGIAVSNISYFDVINSTRIIETITHEVDLGYFLNISENESVWIPVLVNQTSIISSGWNYSIALISPPPVLFGGSSKLLMQQIKGQPNLAGNYTFSAFGVTIDPTISGCATLNDSGNYFLTADVEAVAGSCIIITVKNISLDLQGHYINGSNATNTYGVYSNKLNTTIKNGRIENFSTEIYFNGASNGTIDNITAFTSRYGDSYLGSNGNGIFLTTSANFNTISNSNATSNANGTGILLYTSSNNSIINSTGASTSSSGIYLRTSSNNQITNSKSASTTFISIYLVSNSNFNQIINTSGTSSSHDGIQIELSSNNTVINSNGTSTSGKGIAFWSSSNNSIIDSTGTSTSSVGIYLSSSSNNTIINSIGTSNSNNALQLDTNSNNNQIINSTGTSTSKYGIWLASSSNNNQIINSTGTSSTKYGLFLSDSSSNNITGGFFSSSSTTAGFHSAINITGSNFTIIRNATINSSRACINISQSSENNSFFYNYLYNCTTYIDNKNSNNTFNTTVGGVAQGNYYQNILGVGIYDVNMDGFGDYGTAYPYIANYSNLGSDWGPIGAKPLPTMGNLTTPSAGQSIQNCTLFNISWQNWSATGGETFSYTGELYNSTSGAYNETLFYHLNSSSYEWNTCWFNIGNYTFVLFGNSSLGNVSNRSVNFSLSNFTGVAISAPYWGQNISTGKKFNATWAITGAFSNYQGYLSCNNANYAINFTTTALKQEMNLTRWDNCSLIMEGEVSGLRINSSAINFTRINGAPTVSIILPANNHVYYGIFLDSLNFTWTATDADIEDVLNFTAFVNTTITSNYRQCTNASLNPYSTNLTCAVYALEPDGYFGYVQANDGYAIAQSAVNYFSVEAKDTGMLMAGVMIALAFFAFVFAYLFTHAGGNFWGKLWFFFCCIFVIAELLTIISFAQEQGNKDIENITLALFVGFFAIFLISLWMFFLELLLYIIRTIKGAAQK